MTTAPLDGITVLDLSRVMAGPWASQLLADMGATVIKVERPITGDDTRGWGPPFIEKNGEKQSAYFLSANRGKHSIAVDIATDEGQKIIQELAKQADIVLENFKVGGLKKYHLDYASLSALNPALIYCSITGFGQNGPLANQAGYDYMIQAIGGLMSITGNEDEPMKVGIPIVDITTGLYAVIAIQAALLNRARTGKGEHIDLSLLDTQTALLSNQAMNYLVSGNAPTRIGNRHPNIVPYRSFSTKDTHLILAVGNDEQFRRFCDCAGCHQLAENPNYATNEARVKNRDTLSILLEKIMLTKTTKQWLTLLNDNAVPCGPVNDISEVMKNEQVIHRELERSLSHDQLSAVPTVMNPIGQQHTNIAPPLLGEHTVTILKEKLGYTDNDIQSLSDNKIIQLHKED